jgi:hypothetical protein
MELDTLLEEFNSELEALRFQKLTVLERANSGISLCHGTLDKMRTVVHRDSFKDKKEEIWFFKQIKSIPLGHLVYYSEVRKTQLCLPKLGIGPKLQFLEEQGERINEFYCCHVELYNYFREGREDLDAHYFTRSEWYGHPFDRENYGYDGRFETAHDVTYAKLMGLERFGRYLLELERNLQSITDENTKEPLWLSSPFTFTQSPTAAMELIYALREAKVINHGDFEIKAFVSFFSKAFNIEIKDPYGLFKQISQRKTKRSKFLQHLVDALLNTLDDRESFTQ